MLKSYVWGGGVVAHKILESAQGPLVLALGPKGLGPGLDNSNTPFMTTPKASPMDGPCDTRDIP